MAVSIVKVPQSAAGDMDFLAFSFNGKHSWDDFHIYRTSDGDRYDENLTLTLADKTAEVPGGDGMYYFGTTHKQRDFNISFAFDGLTEVQLRELKKWLNGKDMGDLWFQEAPYKVWTAKPAGNSSIKYIPFSDENGQRVYKGEGTVQFVAYWPYAHTPDYVGSETASGKNFDSYGSFKNSNEWKIASGLTSSTGTCTGENPGDLPAPFILKQDGFIPSGTVFTVGEAEITTTSDCYNLEWDSKTGLVVAGENNEAIERKNKKPIKVQGNTCSAIPIEGTDEIGGEGSVETFQETKDWGLVATETTEEEIGWYELNQYNYKSFGFDKEITNEPVSEEWAEYEVGEEVVCQDRIVQIEDFIYNGGEYRATYPLIQPYDLISTQVRYRLNNGIEGIVEKTNIDKEQKSVTTTTWIMGFEDRYFTKDVELAYVNHLSPLSAIITPEVIIIGAEKTVYDTNGESRLVEFDQGEAIFTLYSNHGDEISVRLQVKMFSGVAQLETWISAPSNESDPYSTATIFNMDIENFIFSITDMRESALGIFTGAWDKTEGPLEKIVQVDTYQLIKREIVQKTKTFQFKTLNATKKTTTVTRNEEKVGGNWVEISSNQDIEETSIPNISCQYHYWYY